MATKTVCAINFRLCYYICNYINSLCYKKMVYASIVFIILSKGDDITKFLISLKNAQMVSIVWLVCAANILVCAIKETQIA